MDARDYLVKAAKICDDHEGKVNCKDCPLHRFSCGSPKGLEDIDGTIELVEHYEEKTYPFGRCSACGKEFNSELMHEYRITNCPW
ncbi:hypothetical protein, partial [Lutispora sp.]|uniref:hypothetical protein n=1 Tax=Lutispora sp. TaxID=2828727 RepID=UPI002B21455A